MVVVGGAVTEGGVEEIRGGVAVVGVEEGGDRREEAGTGESGRATKSGEADKGRHFSGGSGGLKDGWGLRRAWARRKGSGRGVGSVKYHK